MRLLDHHSLLGKVLDLDGDLRHLGAAARLGRLEGSRADEREARPGLPADLRDHGVAERGALADELAVAELEVDIRRRLDDLGADAEAERAVIEARLQELVRRVGSLDAVQSN